ncbi:MAG: ATP-dependent sacrificial sulfur transferase LarE, partial [Spirochaetota bacterium]
AVSALTPFTPDSDRKQILNSEDICILPVDVIADEVLNNTSERCYLCKKMIFEKIIACAAEKGITSVIDGSVSDDESDFRPGKRALSELHVHSPLAQCGIGKDDMESIARSIPLRWTRRESNSCLATRVPTGSRIDLQQLPMIDEAEEYLKRRGLRTVRVRCHDGSARIEVSPEERTIFFNGVFMDECSREFSQIGFKYSSLDLAGYRRGNMNRKEGHR